MSNHTYATGLLLSSSSLTDDDVVNSAGEKLGHIEDLMIDVTQGHIRYAVLSFGGILGLGSKLFAVPWRALRVDTDNECFILDVVKERLENAPGFDKDDWPNMANSAWATQINTYYGS